MHLVYFDCLTKMQTCTKMQLFACVAFLPLKLLCLWCPFSYSYHSPDSYDPGAELFKNVSISESSKVEKHQCDTVHESDHIEIHLR